MPVVHDDAADVDDVGVATLNVDGALFLRRRLAADQFPMVLALMPNVYDDDDQVRVDAVVGEQLAAAGIVDAAGEVHPTIAGWIAAVCRPDREITVRVVAGEAMLRIVIVRAGDEHVVVMRCDDEVVLSSLGSQHHAPTVVDFAGVICDALGDKPACDAEPVTAPVAELSAKSIAGLRAAGADLATAVALNAAATAPVDKYAELELIEHSLDAAPTSAVHTARIVDTERGRVLVAPRRYPGTRQVWATMGPGTRRRLAAALDDMIELLPSQSWE